MKAKYILFLLWYTSGLCAQQLPDTTFVITLNQPKYVSGRGSLIVVDAAHQNFHTIDGRYAPFARVLRQDGYRLESADTVISDAWLERCRIFVISNANVPQQRNGSSGVSAFSRDEIRVLNDWVKNGGRLLLIADHMPFAGSAIELARSFGVEYENCFAMDNRRRDVERFYKSNRTLSDNELTRGIDTIVTFTGSAFRIPKQATGILALDNYALLFPEVAWDFTESTRIVDSKGYFQGAYLPYGKGRLVVMGEAAMFSAQLAGPAREPVGMNHPAAKQNAQLLLNIVHWLDAG